MRIIARKRLLEFARKHPDAYTPLDDWYRITKSAEWKNLEAVKQFFSSAEAVGNFTVFNIKGNTYRLIVDIIYPPQKIYIKYILTHAEYDNDRWKNDPYF